ncbi:MAG: T9SS type A sorting domain-containing protein [Bacteroidia bacterium]
MKNVVIILIYFFGFSASLKGQGNFIIAGNHDTSCYFRQYNPDTLAFNSSIGHFYLDINNDGINDFDFNSYSYPSSAICGGYYTSAAYITGLDSNKVAWDSTIICYYTQYTPKSFTGIDTVDVKSTWTKEVYLESSFCTQNGPGSIYHCSYTWLHNIDTTYVGIRLDADSMQLYGWIKIYNYRIQSYACEKTNYIKNSVKNYLPVFFQINIYPNPNPGFFIIETTSDMQSFDLFDINGKHVFQQQINNKTTIDASFLDSGVYFARVINKSGVTNKKVIIKK